MNNKRILIYINTPAQVHTWKHVLHNLENQGYEINILGRDYGPTHKLLESEGFKYKGFRLTTSRLNRISSILTYISKGYQASKIFHPGLIMGFGAAESLTAKLLRIPSIIFTDSEPIGVQNGIMSLTAGKIITPDCFRLNLGKKHLRINSYKELAYLHPNYFRPDPAVLNELGVESGTRFVILRFNVFDAIHDVGRQGFSTSDQYQLVKELDKYARVFISPEGKLAPELEKYRIPIASHRMHHALYFAHLLVTDTQTMATEAAILGTAVVRCNNFVGPHDMGNFIELEKKYDLLYSFRESEEAIQKAVDLIQRVELKKEWAGKRQKLLNEKIDFTRFFVEYIANYPAKQNPGIT